MQRLRKSRAGKAGCLPGSLSRPTASCLAPAGSSGFWWAGRPLSVCDVHPQQCLYIDPYLGGSCRLQPDMGQRRERSSSHRASSILIPRLAACNSIIKTLSTATATGRRRGTRCRT
ncbi:hypothetical protein N656DRAFT_404143 [Canariomyces notabilis]|uniref:Uncharacterized protein n=1 Tax=Canariomyces notabilis TaxID=2074819 RepID=A0AAN6TK40_9PEZI|nr:hypothetical protein N656DRAFT_404143 [Canariomyces arenarius]